MTFPLAPPIARILEQVLNGMIQYDARAKAQLTELDDRSFAVAIKAPQFRIHMSIGDDRFVVNADADLPADTEVTGSLSALAALAAKVDSGAAGQVQIAGDADTARRFQRFFADLQPDWEEPLTRVLGDVLGYQVAAVLKNVFQWAEDASRNLADSASEYWREESRQLLGRHELESFYDQVDDVRDAVDVLEQRIQKLAAD